MNNESFYRDLDIVDLLQTVNKDIQMLLNGAVFSPEKLNEHFIAAAELMSRVEINHSYHDKNGVNMITSSGYCLDNVEAARDSLRDMDLPDGTILAQMPMGAYHAARRYPEID